MNSNDLVIFPATTIHATGRISRMEGHHHTNFPYNDGNQLLIRAKLPGPTHDR